MSKTLFNQYHMQRFQLNAEVFHDSAQKDNISLRFTVSRAHALIVMTLFNKIKMA